ncbi:hypothetical protein PENSPDRAFT_588563 [Peniophora sp. CONT]|nr:hypothetical protein PENSPDRAFT_588563 [Peniophora sp. CONT]
MGWGVAGAVTLGLGISAFSSRNSVYCEPGDKVGSPTPAAPPKGAPANDGFPDAPKSNINLYELSFGSVCGGCAGVFVKKGAKALAFMLGGVFVLLQYLGSASIVKVDWTKAGNRFERLFYRTDATGARHPPTVGSLWRWLVDFLTADFQPRASFIAGFALGIRIG